MIEKIYVVHHSHTDIGYTHGQSRIIRWHGQFIRQAMEIARRRKDFVWTCETFYPVEQFWKEASADEQEEFKRLCVAGRLGLSGSYLHFNELADSPLLETMAHRARAFADTHQLPLAGGMFADINGVQLIHARALAANGIKFLIVCVHAHHGYVPLGKRQELFKWDLGDGQQMLVLLADHYHTGNRLGLAPGAEANGTAVFPDFAAYMDDDVLERRIPDYLKRVEESGWKHRFIAIAVSGMSTDNAPPSEAIAERIARWNRTHGSTIHIEMTTPAALAHVAMEAHTANPLPAYGGDWPDWWADGTAGDPEAVAIFRHAQRERRFLALLPAANQPSRWDMESLDTSLALFAEHTFGQSGSVRTPWNLPSHQLHLRKVGYAAEAADRAEVMIDVADVSLGGQWLNYNRIPALRVLNPFGHTIRQLVALEIEGCESRRWNISSDRLRIARKDTGDTVPHQIVPSARGGLGALVDITLEAGAGLDFVMERSDPPDSRLSGKRIIVPDGVYDVVGDEGSIFPTSLQTPYVSIQWVPGIGIVSWRDAKSGRELISREDGRAPFTIRSSRLETSQDSTSQSIIRKQLGRNRNGAAVAWQRSKLQRVFSFEQGEHRNEVELDYSLPGCEHVRLRLAAWKRAPRVDIELRLAKIGTWNVENLYLDLPFTAGDESVLWLDRGLPMRPGIDQIPGTLIDYYGVQDGIAMCSSSNGVAIAQFDSHLIQVGPLEYGVRQLAASRQPSVLPWAWLMTNYWETNFSAELGGFYLFRFSVLWGDALADPNHALSQCRDATTPLHILRPADQLLV